MHVYSHMHVHQPTCIHAEPHAHGRVNSKRVLLDSLPGNKKTLWAITFYSTLMLSDISSDSVEDFTSNIPIMFLCLLHNNFGTNKKRKISEKDNEGAADM